MSLGQAVASALCRTGSFGRFVLQERLGAHMASRIGSKSFTLDFPCPFLTQFWLLTLRAATVRSWISRRRRSCAQESWSSAGSLLQEQSSCVRFEFWEWGRITFGISHPSVVLGLRLGVLPDLCFAFSAVSATVLCQKLMEVVPQES